MIQKIWKVENTEQSTLFTSAARQLDLDQWGYEESEYFFSGTANVYGKVDADRMKVLAADAPYTNRFLVRRPKDGARASGRVVVEILNTSSRFDIDRVWVLLHRSLLRSGDTYVGITSKPVTMMTLRKYDPQRYAPLCWDNPRRCIFPVRALGNFCGDSCPETEDGLFWDMLTDLGLILAGKPDFLSDLPVKKVYLTGWSQSGADMIVYSSWFSRIRAEQGLPRAYDGYFCCGPASSVCPGLNQEESVDLRNGDGKLRFADVPFLQMQTESENARLGNAESRTPDADLPEKHYRVYGIPGATHDSVETMENYYRDHTEMERVGLYLTYPGRKPNPNDFPYWMAFQAAYRCFCQWCEEDVLPPQVPPISVRGDLSNVTDESGNAVGGWRLPEIELPVCVYQPMCTPLIPGTPTLLYGAELPYSADELKKRYGTLERYRQLVEQAADRAVAGRLLDPADRDECVEHAVEKARRYGLNGGAAE